MRKKKRNLAAIDVINEVHADDKKAKKDIDKDFYHSSFFVVLEVCEHTELLSKITFPVILIVIYLLPYLLISYDIIIKALKNIRHGQIFDENFLMIVATVAAFCVQEFSEAVAVMLLYQIGELFQSYAVGKSRQSVTAMMDIVLEYANIEEDGELIQVNPDDVEIGTIITIKPGERIPLDGIVTEGESLVDTAALTGEAVPRRAMVGDEVISGCVNGSNTLKVRTTKVFDDSTVTRILELVENASSKKAKLENFITRFARVCTPFVTICAAVLAVIPPIISGGGWIDWIQRACIFPVISCSCALVISVPLGFFGGIGAASKIGVLVKGSNYLEALSEVNTIVFDKTGTLTKGEFKVSNVLPIMGTEEELLELAALGECYSNHPIANSIREAYQKTPDISRVAGTRELAGYGIHACVDGKAVYLGNAKLMQDKNIAYKENQSAGTVIYVAVDKKFIGSIVISDTIKDGAKESIHAMKRAGVKKCVMLTGDRQKAANELGIDDVHSELLPTDKVGIIEEMLEKQAGRERLAFAGDGINDAPVLARADIGITMGSMGLDAAIEAADIVIMDDNPRKIAAMVKIARKTVRIVKQNIVFALGVKTIVMILGVLGMANMWMAVIGDVGVAIIAILNSMRALNAEE